VPAYFKINKERRLVMSTAAGVLTLADALTHQESLLMNPNFHPSFCQLIDFKWMKKTARLRIRES
jgi:hypothetical protein